MGKGFHSQKIDKTLFKIELDGFWGKNSAVLETVYQIRQLAEQSYWFGCQNYFSIFLMVIALVRWSTIASGK